MSLSGTNELFKALNGNRQRQVLVQEKLEQWDCFDRFLAMNLDVKARYEVHKTYEILKNDNGEIKA